jgi:uncharacterized SAM-binding protein YcdF (DUF218 family)
MREVVSPAVPDSFVGELWALVRVYRGRSVFPEGDSPDRAEAAVVLGAQVLPDGRSSGTLRARTRHAARLYTEGQVGLVIPTGGVGEYPPSEAEVAERILREAGVPEEAILLEAEARNTWESARLVGEMARKRGIRSLLLVTDPLHCVRTLGVFQAEGLLVRASPVYSSPMWREWGPRLGQFLREIAAVTWYRIRHRAESPIRR